MDNIITDLCDDDLYDILSKPVHRLDILERIKQDFSTPKSKSYRRSRKLPYKNTRRRHKRSSSF